MSAGTKSKTKAKSGEPIQVRTCDGTVEGRKCAGRCKRELPLRCFDTKADGSPKALCTECGYGKSKRPSWVANGFFFGDEWDF